MKKHRCLSVGSDASAHAMLSTVVPPGNNRLVGVPVVPKLPPAPLCSQFVRLANHLVCGACCLFCRQFGAQRFYYRDSCGASRELADLCCLACSRFVPLVNYAVLWCLCRWQRRTPYVSKFSDVIGQLGFIGLEGAFIAGDLGDQR